MQEIGIKKYRNKPANKKRANLCKVSKLILIHKAQPLIMLKWIKSTGGYDGNFA